MLIVLKSKIFKDGIKLLKQ